RSERPAKRPSKGIDHPTPVTEGWAKARKRRAHRGGRAYFCCCVGTVRLWWARFALPTLRSYPAPGLPSDLLERLRYVVADAARGLRREPDVVDRPVEAVGVGGYGFEQRLAGRAPGLRQGRGGT